MTLKNIFGVPRWGQRYEAIIYIYTYIQLLHSTSRDNKIRHAYTELYKTHDFCGEVKQNGRMECAVCHIFFFIYFSLEGGGIDFSTLELVFIL